MGKKSANPARGQRPIIYFWRGKEMRIDKDALAEAGYDPDVFVPLIKEWHSGENATMAFAKFFFAESFKRQFTPSRREYARSISDPTIANGWGMAFRGFGKTTILWAEAVRRIVFRQCPFLVYVSSELGLAERRTENIRIAITRHPRIIQFFGRLSPQYMEGVRDVFGAKAWKLADPKTNEAFALVTPKSDETTVNGLVEYVAGEFRRPNWIIVDDVTDRKRVHDEKYRAHQRDWAFGTLFPCVDTETQPNPETHRWDELKRGAIPPWQILVVDTCKHSDALIETCASHPEFIGERHALASVDEHENVISLVPHMSDEQAQALYDRQKRAGKQDRFFKEYVCRSRPPDDASFPTEYQYYKDRCAVASGQDKATALDINNDPDVIRMIIVDPARSRNPRSAYTAMLAVGVNPRIAKVYLRGMIHAKLSDVEIAVRLLRFAKAMNTDIIGVEDAGLSDWIRGPLERTASAAGMYPHWMWIPTGRKHIEADGEYRSIKEIRGSSALWLYRPSETHPTGHVLHEESLRNGPLEQQQQSFPECREWDAMDTLGHLDWMMRELGIVFDEQVDPQILDDAEYRSDYELFGDWIHSGQWRVA